MKPTYPSWILKQRIIIICKNKIYSSVKIKFVLFLEDINYKWIYKRETYCPEQETVQHSHVKYLVHDVSINDTKCITTKLSHKTHQKG
jgi:hypothetical protein